MASLPLAQGHVQSDIHQGLRQLLEDQGLATKDIEDGLRAAPADAGTACGGTPTNNPKDRSRSSTPTTQMVKTKLKPERAPRRSPVGPVGGPKDSMEDYKSLMDDTESISTSRSASQTQKVKASPTAAADKGQNGSSGINPGAATSAVPLLRSTGADGPSNPTARQPAQKGTIADEDEPAQRSASKILATSKDVDAKRAITDSDPTELIELSVKHRKIDLTKRR